MGFSSALPIALGEIRAYIEGFTDLETLSARRHFLKMVKTLDGTWLDIQAKRAPPNPPAAPKPR